MAQLSKGQKKIIILSISIVIFLSSFWLFIYLPQKKKLAFIKEELLHIQTQIAEINKMTEGRDLTEAVKSFNEQLSTLSKLFSFSEEEIISNLSREAKKLNIEINTIKPLEKQLVKDTFNIKELPISIELSAEFRDLSTYLKILRDNFPVLITVKRLEIKGGGEGKDILNVNLQISVYLSN